MLSKARYIFILFFLFRISVPAQDSFVIGEFTISKVIDGDTFKLDSLDKSTRLLGIDTEETYKGKNAEQQSDALKVNWLEHYNEEKVKENKPAKIDSPFGFKTWQWTKDLFRDVVKVRLEKEDDNRLVDSYGRYLVYVIAIKNDGTEFNYNIECVKNGYSAYFSKYGYSKRFHKNFTDAQQFARENKLGIWSGSEYSYPDYDERINWWNRRANEIEHFDSLYSGKQGYFSLGNQKDVDNLRNHIGEEVTVFGNFAAILKNKEPYLIRFPLSDRLNFDVTLFPDQYSLIPQIEKLEGDYVYVKGIVKDYKDKLEIDLTSTKNIWIE